MFYIFFRPSYWRSIFILAEASIARQHKNSFLGSMWGVAQPCIHIITISYVFSFLLKQPSYTMISNLVAGLTLWHFLFNASVGATKSLIDRGGALRKVYISKTILPIVDVLVHLYTFAYSFVTMYFVFVLMYPENFSLSILYTPIAILPAVISMISVGVALAYITPYIMDLTQIISVILGTLYWSLPIIYPYEMIPPQKRWLFEINPLFHLMRPLQVLVLEGRLPCILVIMKSILVMITSIIISYFIVRRISKNVIYYL